MAASWMFKEATPGDRARESVVEKFFNSDAVSSRANAIVREGIQNSLDAADAGARVRVRIALGRWSDDGAAARLNQYMAGFREHFEADGVQSKISNPPQSGEPFRYLLFEDFGTFGLRGDPALWWPDANGTPNPFFNYFRAEGISDKTEGARGRHGVGRLVFMFASRIRSMIALTRRLGTKEAEDLVMGTTVLRSHRLNGVPYLPDGWFGLRSPSSALVLPVQSNKTFTDKFRADFNIARTTETGLSVVVPWLSEEVTAPGLIRATLEGYFYPILRDELSVEIVAEDGAVETISAQSIDDVLTRQSTDFSVGLRPMIALARSSLGSTTSIALNKPRGATAPKWELANIPEGVRGPIQSKLDSLEVLSIRVPMSVRSKVRAPADCHFQIFARRDPSLDEGKITFIREGIIIADVRPRRTSKIRALVIVDDGPLAAFLGDSENPSHTEWQKELVKDKYYYAPGHIEYVVHSVPQILALLSSEHQKPDASLLLDLFSLSVDEAVGMTAGQRQPTKPSGDDPGNEPIEVTSRPKRFVVDNLGTGFVVRSIPEVTPPDLLEIKLAYGVRRGSPFAKYKVYDFKLFEGLTRGGFGYELTGFGNNWLRARITDDQFRIEVTGFDTNNRDLHIDCRPVDDSIDDSEEAE